MQRLRNERGATAILLALLMVPLLGFGAIAVDVGDLYAQRRALQNAADAGALAAAQDCAAESPRCADKDATAQHLADANTNASSSTTADVTGNSATVTAETTVNHFLAPMIGIDSSDVGARATAVWGGPSDGPAVLPITFAYCGFDGHVGEHQEIRYDENRPDCPDTDIPGGFGWLDHDSGCALDNVSVDTVLDSEPGNSPADDCVGTLAELKTKIEDGEDVTVILPVHDEAYGGGNTGTYKIKGFAAFQITGWKFGGGSEWTFNTSLNGNERGIEGQFVEYVAATDFTPDPDVPCDPWACVVALSE